MKSISIKTRTFFSKRDQKNYTIWYIGIGFIWSCPMFKIQMKAIKTLEFSGKKISIETLHYF
jgi:hypothetical protein